MEDILARAPKRRPPRQQQLVQLVRPRQQQLVQPKSRCQNRRP
jgi:hypothetical protein